MDHTAGKFHQIITNSRHQINYLHTDLVTGFVFSFLSKICQHYFLWFSKAVKSPEENICNTSKEENKPKGKTSKDEIKKTLKRKSEGNNTQSSTSKKPKEGRRSYTLSSITQAHDFNPLGDLKFFFKYSINVRSCKPIAAY